MSGAKGSICYCDSLTVRESLKPHCCTSWTNLKLFLIFGMGRYPVGHSRKSLDTQQLQIVARGLSKNAPCQPSSMNTISPIVCGKYSANHFNNTTSLNF